MTMRKKKKRYAIIKVLENKAKVRYNKNNIKEKEEK